MQEKSFVLKGDVCCSKDPKTLAFQKDGFLVCLRGLSAGVFAELPARYRALPCRDYSGRLILPGLTDLHVHAPQYGYRGLGMDLELLEWLDTRTFPAEARYGDPEYGEKAYRDFVEDVKRGPNTRVCVFATVHVPATLKLMDLLEASGLKAFVGKVNMDRNCPDGLREKDAASSLAATLEWLEKCRGRYQNVRPILTPRFIPSCTDRLLEGLGRIQREYGLPVQSHLSENLEEIAWVKKLCPDAAFYGEAYRRHSLFGGAAKTVMAHCVYSGEEEIRLMKEQGVYVAHCPMSNTNLSSGIAPVRRYLEEGLALGLGSDVAGGYATSIFRAMADAIQVSKLRWRLSDQSLKALTLPEAFYLGTIGGGSFFGKTGSFDQGNELDALVVDDRPFNGGQELTIPERLERVIYLSGDQHIEKKFVAGRALW